MARHRAVNADPSCWTCKLGRYEPGGMATLEIQPEPDHMECTLMDGKDGFPPEVLERLEEVEWVEDKCPSICGRFEPVMIEKCGFCGVPMNVPEYSHAHYVNHPYGDPIPVHPECEAEADAKFRREEQLMEAAEKALYERLDAEEL